MKKILLTLLYILLPLLGWAQENEPYAVLSDNSTVLTFYYDDHKAERNGLSVGPFYSTENQSWSAEREVITIVAFDTSFAGCSTLTSTAYWFNNCINLTTISGIENLNTANVTDMNNMFSSCNSLTSLDLSGFRTDNVTNMVGMFASCWGLTSLDLSGFNTANVTNMAAMFTFCSRLTTIYVGEGWTAANVSEGSNMFTNCSNLFGGKGTKYDGEHTDYIYARIDQGPDSDAPGYFTRSGDAPWSEPTAEAYAVLSDSNTVLTFYYDNQKAVRNGMSVGQREWAENSKDITSVVFDLSFANDSTLTSTAKWFSGFENLKVITGMENLNTFNVTRMDGMFYKCMGLTSLDLSNFNTSNVTNMCDMFSGCSSLTNLNVSSFNTDNVTNMQGLFWSCNSLPSLNLNNFNTSNVSNMSYMFDGCSGLTSLDLSGFNTSNVTSIYGMFNGCYSLVSLDLSGFNTSNVTAIGTMFLGCSGLTSLDLSNFNTSNVSNMSYMFGGCEVWGTERSV